MSTPSVPSLGAIFLWELSWALLLFPLFWPALVYLFINSYPTWVSYAYHAACVVFLETFAVNTYLNTAMVLRCYTCPCPYPYP